MPPLHHRCKAAALLALFGLVLAPLSASAVEMSIDVQPRSLTLGETTTLTLTLTGQSSGNAPALDRVDGFQVRYVGTSSQVIGRSRSISYQYRLFPSSVGDFNVGPFSMDVGGKTVSAPAIQVKVLPRGQEVGVDGKPLATHLWVTAEASKTNLYTQEVFDIDIALYHDGSVNLSGQSRPSAFEAEGIKHGPFHQLQDSLEVVDGRRCRVRRWRCKARALSAGSYDLKAWVAAQILVDQGRGRRFGSIDFMMMRQTRQIDLAAKPLHLEVSPPPLAGQPPNYQGAVGRFAFKASARPTALKEGDPVTIRLYLRIPQGAEGNLGSAIPPFIEENSDFKVYEPKMIQHELNDSETGGHKVFEQVVIPRRADLTELPAMSFSYFDPARAAYVSITEGPFPLSITPDTNAVERVVGVQEGGDAGGIEILGEDLIYLKTAPPRWKVQGQAAWHQQPAFRYAQTAPPFLLGLAWLLARRRESLRQNVGKARRIQAPRVARAALQRAEQARKNKSSEAFYAAYWEALNAYFANRLNIGPGEVSADRVSTWMETHNAPPEISTETRALLDRCDQQRYAAGVGSTWDADATRTELDRLQQLIRTCERRVK